MINSNKKNMREKLLNDFVTQSYLTQINRVLGLLKIRFFSPRFSQSSFLFPIFQIVES